MYPTESRSNLFQTRKLNNTEINFLAGGGEMGARIRERDWSKTPLGSPEQWQQSLKTAVRIMLTSRQPMFVWWGEELINLYNDAYKAIVGGKHPEALGQSAAVVWREIWDQVGPRAASVLLNNEGTYDESLLLIMERNGYPEETYYTFSYSPIPNDQGGTGGIICANTDNTQRIIGERQLALLQELAAKTADARTFTEACALSANSLETNPYDIPFAMIYLVEPKQQLASLAATCGIDRGHKAAPETLTHEHSIWCLADLLQSSKACLVADWDPALGNLPTGAWQRPPHQIVAMRISPSGQTGRSGILVIGLNPFRLFDNNYRRFIELVAAQIGASIANAQAYEEERQRAETLAELDRAKTAFFSNVSHEFRTPLTLMLGPTEDALTDQAEPLPPTQRGRIEIVQRNGWRLLKLVNTLLDFSRIEAGRVQAVYEPTDLAAFTAELASMFRACIERAHLQLTVDCPPLPELVYVDREMWEKIVLNLLSNAFKFTFQGEISVRLRWLNDVVELVVRDTGIGIPGPEIPHLFERFHRVKGAQGRSFEGSGIGLSLVQELVKLHSGTIQVTSVEGEGTCFTIKIPSGTAHLPPDQISTALTPTSSVTGAALFVEEAWRWLPEEERAGGASGAEVAGGDKRDGEASGAEVAGGDKIQWSINSSPPASPASPAPLLSSARVLVVDDNADMRDYVKRLLSQRYYVETVANGLTALDAIRQQPPNLVLTDVMMPGLDGFQLLRALRANSQTQNIPIILLSARAGEESRIEGLEAGADDYLVKPFSARELIARVEATLKLARLRQEAAHREQQLRIEAQTARAELERVLASINDQFLMLDHEWRYTYVNERVVEIVGRRREDLLGRSIWELFPDMVGSQFYTEVHRAVAEQTAIYFEYFYPTWNRWFENHVYPSPEGVVIFVTEITDRKQAEVERLQRLAVEQQNTHRLQKLAEAAISITSTLSLNERLQLITEQARDIIGAHQSVTSMTIDDNWAQAIHTVSLSEKYAQWRDYAEQPNKAGIYSLVCQMQRPLRMTQAELEAHPAWREFGSQAKNHPPMRGWLVAPLSSVNGKNNGLIQLSDKYEGDFTAEDEAMLVQLAQMASVVINNAQLYEESQRANRIKDEFLAVLSHELRSPLNPILGWIQLLQAGKLSQQATQRALETIERNAKLQTQLIEDLLDVSRILRGKLVLNVVPTNLATTIRAALDTVQLAAEAKQIEIQTIFAADELQVSGDAARLQQIVWNLLSNAVKFTPAGGRVEVRLEQVGTQAQIQVKDTGIGISPAFLPHVFEYFLQEDGTTTRKFGGLGLGLAIVRHLSELHGGTVRAESPGEGLGATFTVKIPLLASKSEPQEQVNSSPSNIDLSGLRVLVVDDEADMRDLVRFILEQHKAVVNGVASAPEALAVLEQFQPDMLLSDIGMPEMDGYMLMRQVRARAPEQGGQIPAIALTAYAGEFNQQQALQAGFQLHLAKPIEPERLIQAIANLICQE